MRVQDTEQASGVAARSRVRTARYVLILGGLTAFGPLATDMYLPALPAMAGELGSTDAVMQLTLTVFMVGMALGQLVAGPLSDSWGRRRPLVAGVTLFVVASVLCAVSSSPETLIAARLLQSLGAAAGIVIARAAVRDLYSGVAMARFFSMLMLVSGLAPVLAPVIGGQVLAWTSWRGVFGVLAGIGAVLLLGTAFALPDTLPVQRRRPARVRSIARTYVSLLRDRAFVGYALTLGLAFAVLFTYISGSSFVLQGTYGLTATEYSLVFAANGVGIVVTGQVNGRLLVGRFRQRSLLLTGLLLSLAGSVATVAAAAVGAGLAGVLVPLFVTVSSVGLVMPNATALGLADHPRSAGSASALLGVTQFLIAGCTAPLAGLAGTGSASPMAAIMAGFSVLALTGFLTLTRRPAAVPEPV